MANIVWRKKECKGLIGDCFWVTPSVFNKKGNYGIIYNTRTGKYKAMVDRGGYGTRAQKTVATLAEAKQFISKNRDK